MHKTEDADITPLLFCEQRDLRNADPQDMQEKHAAKYNYLFIIRCLIDNGSAGSV